MSRRSGLWGTAHSRLPSGIYVFIPSSVLFEPPTTYRPFTVLPFWSFDIPSLHTRNGVYGFSPVDTPSLYYMNSSFRHRQSICYLAITKADISTSVLSTTSSFGFIVFRCSITIPATMLSTLRVARYHATRKTRFRCCGLQLIGRTFAIRYMKRP